MTSEHGDEFWPPTPSLRRAEEENAALRERANKHQTNNAALADLISFISYDLLK
jgi:hypothetical protein